MPFTYYIATKDAKVYQINNVTAITIATPLVSNGTYRDSPPATSGGGAGALGADASVSVSGGVDPIVTLDGILNTAVATAASSIEQDDTFVHVAPRYLNSPIGFVFFTTTAGIATAPTGTTFSTTPPTTPGGNFSVVDCDCAFLLDEIVGWYNAPPQGWAPTRSIVTAYNES